METGGPEMLFDPRPKDEIRNTAVLEQSRKEDNWNGDVWSDLLLEDDAVVSEEVLKARESSIKFDGVEIITLEGQHTAVLEYLGDVQRPVWEFEPNPNMEKRVIEKRSVNEVEVKAFGGNDEKIWSFFREN